MGLAAVPKAFPKSENNSLSGMVEILPVQAINNSKRVFSLSWNRVDEPEIRKM
jgi:hypothetical protein